MISLNSIALKFGDIAVALMINLHLINYAVFSYSNSTTGFSSIIYSVFILFSIFIWIAQNELLLDFKRLFLFCIIILWYLIDQSIARINLMMLLACVGMPLFVLSNIKFSVERVLYYTVLISAVFIPGFPILLARSLWGNVDMDVAYSVLPAIVAAQVHFSYYRKKRKKIELLVYLIALFYVIQFFMYGLRGPILGIFITAFLTKIFRLADDGCSVEKKMNRYTCFAFIVGFLIIIFFENIAVFSLEIANNLNIDVHFLEKTVRLIKAGDLSNGREWLRNIALNGFVEAPVFGHGFDSFDYYTREAYPHNFILQTLYDGGVFALVSLIVIFVFGLFRMFKTKSVDKIAWFVFLIPIGFVYPMVSQDMYNVYYFWMLIAFFLLSERRSPLEYNLSTIRKKSENEEF